MGVNGEEEIRFQLTELDGLWNHLSELMPSAKDFAVRPWTCVTPANVAAGQSYIQLTPPPTV